MKIMFDTNVVLDLLLDREAYSLHAAELFTNVEHGRISGYLCADGVTTIYYIISKALGAREARKRLQQLLSLFEIAPVNQMVLKRAIEKKFRDFEDAVIHEAALHAGVNAIVTRNVIDFKYAEIPVLSPLEMVGMMRAGESIDD